VIEVLWCNDGHDRPSPAEVHALPRVGEFVRFSDLVFVVDRVEHDAFASEPPRVYLRDGGDEREATDKVPGWARRAG
jgi:hypothetical protein